ncbi:MAG: protein kinase [Xanthomonadales bacterium]|nr:protein kinase [Xanthomonadales bacterium]
MGDDRKRPHFGRENAEALLGTGGGLLTGLADGPTAPEPDPWLGVQVGPYRIDEFLDAGGMSLVFRAERVDGEFEQQVAVKILRAGDAAPLSERFERERQLLARMEHPGIARIIDSGQARGHSWIAMELVAGERIDLWCDRQRLTLNRRLALFCRVAEAVQFAHGRLVIHRDIKPANVLVTDDGAPRLLDFGIAKALSESDQAGLTGPTMLLTPRYASPEQVLGEPTGVASDIYQLGLLLYRLLTGQDAQHLETPSLAEIQQVVVDQEPLSPSRQVEDTGRQSGKDSGRIAAARQITVERLERALSGDLDAIVLKALEKEPQRRYATVLDLIRDVQNYRSSRPVIARPATRAYRASRFVARHRGGFLVGMVMAMVLLGALLLSWQSWRQTLSANAEAQRQAATADAVASFLGDLLAKADPRDTGTQELTVRELLDGSQSQLDDLSNQPAVQARLRVTMAEAYYALDAFDQALTLIEPAIDYYQQVDDTRALVRAKSQQADILMYLADYADAEAVARSALELAGAHALEMERARAQTTLAAILADTGQYESAYELAQKAVAAEIGDSAYEIRYNRAVLHTILGITSSALGRLEQAEQHFQDGLAVTAGASDQKTQEQILLSRLGTLYVQQERLAQGEATLIRALGLAEEIYSGPHQTMLTPLILLGQAQVALSKLDAARDSFDRAEAVIEATLGLDHPNHAMLLYYRTSLLEREGRLAEAEGVLDQALALGTATLGADHPVVLRFGFRQSELARAAGREAEARTLLLTLRPRLVAALGEDHPLVAQVDRALAVGQGLPE